MMLPKLKHCLWTIVSIFTITSCTKFQLEQQNPAQNSLESLMFEDEKSSPSNQSKISTQHDEPKLPENKIVTSIDNTSILQNTLKLTSEITEETIFCSIEKLPKEPELMFPTDLAVSSDGTTVYAINTGCTSHFNQAWMEGKFYYLRGFSSNFPSSCANFQNPQVKKPHYIYKIQENKPAEIVTFNGKTDYSCSLGLDLEKDSQDRIYFTNALDKKIVRFDGQKLETVMKSVVNPTIFRPFSPNDFHDYYETPIDLKIYGNEIHYSYKDYSYLNYKSPTFVNTNIYSKFNYETQLQTLLTSLSNQVSGGRINILPIKQRYLFFQETVIPFYSNTYLEQFNYLPFDMSYPQFKRNPIKVSSDSLRNDENLYENRIAMIDMIIDGEKIYIADILNHIIWKISLNSYLNEANFSRFAGSGQLGYNDGEAHSAQFSYPTALSLDKDGNLFVADTGNHAIRKITTEGRVSTIYKAK